jgi:hypothetical protein
MDDMDEGQRDKELDRIEAMGDDELEALIEPVWERPTEEWADDQLMAAFELDLRLGVVGQTRAEMDRHPDTQPMSFRVPVDLLDRIRDEARRRSTPYDRLIRELVEAGLTAG